MLLSTELANSVPVTPGEDAMEASAANVIGCVRQKRSTRPSTSRARLHPISPASQTSRRRRTSHDTMGHQARRLREHHRRRPSQRSLQSHWSAYSVQWLTLGAPPPRVSASAFPDDAPWLRTFCFIHSFTDPSVKRTGYGDVDDDFRNDGSGFLLGYASRWNQFIDPNNTTIFIGGLSG